MRFLALYALLFAGVNAVGCASSPSASPTDKPCAECMSAACVECDMCQAKQAAGEKMGCLECPTCLDESADHDNHAASAASGGTGIPADGEVAVITAKGMSCPLCASNADRRLKKLPGVNWVDIDLGTGQVKVGVDENDKPTDAALTEAIDEAGFTTESVTWQQSTEAK